MNKKFKLSIVILSVLFIASTIIFLNHDKVRAVNNDTSNINQMVIKSLPLGVELKYREVEPNGVKLIYSNNEYTREFKTVTVEILKPDSEIKSLRMPGQGGWLPAAQSKTIKINNVPTTLKLQIDNNERIPWIELTNDDGRRIVNVFSRNFTEEEIISMLSSISETNEKLKDYKVIQSQFDEISSVISSNKSKDVKKISESLSSYSKKGWKIKEITKEGNLNEVNSIELSGEDQTIKLYVGNGSK